MERLRARDEWRLIRVLKRADPLLVALWWLLLVARGILPALFAIAMGLLIGAVQAEGSLAGPLALVGAVFVLVQILSPLHLAVSANLGSRTAAWLYDELTKSCVEPPGMAHLEDPELVNDLTMARDFDLGISGPPLSISMDFIASGLVELLAGLASAAVLAAYAWWAPLVLGGAWLATHWLLRESGVWKDRNTEVVRDAQRHADYAYRLAVDAPSSKELRLFGLAGWTVERFRRHRRKLHDLRWEATKLRERPLATSLVLVTLANAVVFAAMAVDVNAGDLALNRMVMFASAAIATSMIAFGGLSWALDGAAAPAAAVLRLRASMAPKGALTSGTRSAEAMPAREIRFRDVSFAYPTTPAETVLDGFDLTIPAGSSLAIVGQNGAGKTTLAKLLCRLYEPVRGAIEVDGVDTRELDTVAWRRRLTAVFQDFVRFELPLKDNVAPRGGAPGELIEAALERAGAGGLAALDTILARGYDGGTDLSGGQWQRVALARAIAAVRQGAGVVLLDEPTAQLDVRGEAEIFDRILEETRGITTILISHRFSTVRHADRICVLEGGRVVELGSHDELMALGGRYRTMFDLQAQRFGQGLGEPDEEALDVLE
ncbi:MAG: ABC transporter ATP-binding protein [Gammaproteobacteria bacterium]|nr:ABC transporter ATP-binding protein [Gammaproteobacteria bacterium]MYF27839.1 ABC transporter ATP-binding protein [Gammaproteobacteria bacterium]MYK45269.1 ABC transporter ATP-binding protein [Gammaproteobacteria bacterium]